MLQQNDETLPSVKWKSLGKAKIDPVASHCAVHVPKLGTIFFIGGANIKSRDSSDLLYQNVFSYNNSTGSFSQVKVFPSEQAIHCECRYLHTCTLVNDYLIYIIGGQCSGDVFSDVLVLNTETMQLEKLILQQDIDPIVGHTATLVGDCIYVIGGFHEWENNRSILVFDTSTLHQW